VKYFGNKSAARTQDFRSDRERRLGQRHDPQMVGRGMAGGRRVADGAMSLSTTSAGSPSAVVIADVPSGS
jgi:hypothetical protein